MHKCGAYCVVNHEFTLKITHRIDVILKFRKSRCTLGGWWRCFNNEITRCHLDRTVILNDQS